MAVSAQDVKKLREETGAPMGECKAALDESGGDMQKAKDILREKGQAAAAKRADRNTSEGVALVAFSADKKTAGGVILETETDFVASNENFRELGAKLASGFVTTAPGPAPLEISIDGKSADDLIKEGVALLRENIQLKKAIQMTGDYVGGYIHHDRKSSAIVVLSGTHDKAEEIAKEIGMQVVSLKASYLAKEEIPQDVIEAEFDIQKRRAIEEGKPENIAENIARGRVNKEFYQETVLLEQMFFKDGKRTVGQYLKDETGGALTVAGFTRLTVGEVSAN